MYIRIKSAIVCNVSYIPPVTSMLSCALTIVGECDQVTKYLCTRLEWIPDLPFRTMADATNGCDDIINQEDACTMSVPPPVIKTSRKRQKALQTLPPSIPASSSSISATCDTSSLDTDAPLSSSYAPQQQYQYSEVSDRIFRVHCEPLVSCMRFSAPSTDQTCSLESDIKPTVDCRSFSATRTKKQIHEESAEEVVVKGDKNGGTAGQVSVSKRSALISVGDAPPAVEVSNICRAVTRSLANKSASSSSSPQCSLRTDTGDSRISVNVKNKINIVTQRRGVVFPPKPSATVQPNDVEVVVKRRRGRPKNQPP